MPARTWTLYSVLLLQTLASPIDVTIERYTESSGLYYVKIGDARLYSAEWKIVTYVDLDAANRNLETVKNYARLSIAFCKEHEQAFWVNFTNCVRTIRSLDGELYEIEKLKSFLAQLTGFHNHENQTRFKRGVFDLIGGISKMLFGTLDSTDASYYTDKITSLEREQLEFLKLSGEQMIVIKSTLMSSNMTMQFVHDNEKVFSRELENLAKHVNGQFDEVRILFTAAFMMTAINEHATQLARALGECRRHYEILIEAILNAQKGILQPHVISPMQIINRLIQIQTDIPSDLMLPFPLSATYHHYVNRLVDIDVFLKDKFLVYIVHVPLTNHIRYEMFHILSLPIRIKDSQTKFALITPECEYLLMDVAKRYIRLQASECKECKVINNGYQLCKQHNLILLKQSNEV
jgi:hypothetical protein